MFLNEPLGYRYLLGKKLMLNKRSLTHHNGRGRPPVRSIAFPLTATKAFSLSFPPLLPMNLTLPSFM